MSAKYIIAGEGKVPFAAKVTADYVARLYLQKAGSRGMQINTPKRQMMPPDTIEYPRA